MDIVGDKNAHEQKSVLRFSDLKASVTRRLLTHLPSLFIFPD
jgi:hypothetical protein